MKKIFALILILFIAIGCSSDNQSVKNPYLPNYAFSIVINMGLPMYSGLQSPINPIFISDGASGVNIIIMKVSNTDYRAWDASCPNQYPSACSVMKIKGVNAKCDCDDIEYSLFTGIGAGEHPMKAYFVQVLDDTTIRVYNN